MYAITFKESARRELYALPSNMLKRVAEVIDRLSQNPRPPGGKKLKGQTQPLWRIRTGDYRIIYAIDDVVRIVNIRRIGHRKEVYD